MATFRTVWSRVCTSIQIHVDIVKVVVCYLVHLDLIDRGSIILQTSFDRRVFSCRGLKQISESFSVIEADTGGRFNSVSHEPSALRLVPRNPPATANFCKKTLMFCCISQEFWPGAAGSALRLSAATSVGRQPAAFHRLCRQRVHLSGPEARLWGAAHHHRRLLGAL